MKLEDDEAKITRRVSDCSEMIRNDSQVRELWRAIAAGGWFGANEESAFDNLVGTVAGLHFALPKKNAMKRYERRRRLERAIDKFRGEIETYCRQSGDGLPSPSDVIYRADVSIQTEAFLRQLPTLDVDSYLEALEDHLRDAEGGTWIHPWLSTATGRWPSTPNSTAIVWIIRTLDMVGVPRTTKRDRDTFLRLGVRLSEMIQISQPPCDITPSRKDFEIHPEFTGIGEQRWRR